MALSDLAIPDRVTGVFVGIVHRLGKSVENTVEASEIYRSKTMDTMFHAPAGVPFAEVRRRWGIGDLVSEDISFPSSYDPMEPAFAKRYAEEYSESHIVWARRIRPPGSEGRPRILYLHGYMQPETRFEEMTLLTGMAKALNVEVVHMQPPYHGRRRPGGSRFDGELYWSADVVRSIEAMRQTLIDAQTVVSWMAHEDDRPIGVAGISMGGALSAAMACLEPRLSFAIPIIAHNDLGMMTADAPVLGRMRRDLASFGWTASDFGELVDSFGWNAMRPAIPAERIWIYAGSQDAFFRKSRVEQMAADFGGAPLTFYPTSHMGFIPRLPFVAQAVRPLIDEVAGS